MKNKKNLVISMKGIISIIFFCLFSSFAYSQEVPFDQLNLTGSALYAATRIKEKFPSVVFTGGTRTLDSQARAVAQNIYRSQNSSWVGATYRDSSFIRKLNQEIINNWDSIKGSESLILQTVNRVFESDNAGARLMSKHLSGYAFDLRVNSVNYNDLNTFVRTLPGFNQFLTQEGGLTVWHIEFNEAPIPATTNTSQTVNLEGTWVGVDNNFMYIFNGSNYTLRQNNSGWVNVERGTFSLNTERTKFTQNCTHYWDNNSWVAFSNRGIWDLSISGNRFTITGYAGENLNEYFNETYRKQ